MKWVVRLYRRIRPAKQCVQIPCPDFEPVTLDITTEEQK